MYILISQDKAITTDGILGIFDLDNTTVSKASREYINYAEKSGECETVSFEFAEILYSKGNGRQKKSIYITVFNKHCFQKIKARLKI